MAPKRSAGLLVFRHVDTDGGSNIKVLLAHPGGPFWAKKDKHGWSIPKGEYDDDEDPAEAAEREFTEELGAPAPPGPRIDLGEIRQSNKIVRVWAIEGNFDATSITSNTFDMEWPPKSGRNQSFPEVDRAEWFDLDVAQIKLHKGQVAVVDALLEALDR